MSHTSTDVQASDNLLVDLGNTRLKWAFAAKTEWEMGAVASGDIDDDARLSQLWRGRSPQRVVVASVTAPARLARLLDWLKQNWRIEPHVVQARREGFGVRNHYDIAERLGSDRWAALIAVRQREQRAAIVIDAGTAVTIDALSADGEFLGGVILPGLNLARECVAAGTAAIGVEEGDASTCLARSTADALAAGSRFGLAGAIERISAEHRRALGADAQLYITGGDAARLLPLLAGAANHVPDLVLKGLAVIAEQLS